MQRGASLEKRAHVAVKADTERLPAAGGRLNVGRL